MLHIKQIKSNIFYMFLFKVLIFSEKNFSFICKKYYIYLQNNITNMIDYNFINEKLKEKGFKLNKVAELMGVQYQTLYKNLKKGSLDTLKRISEVTGIYFFEFIPAPTGYVHIYENGTWQGIMRKPTYHEEKK